jgi:hypothetical protein
MLPAARERLISRAAEGQNGRTRMDDRSRAAATVPAPPFSDGAVRHVSWRSHPARERRALAAALILFLVALAASLWLLTSDAAITLLAGLLLGGALTPWFLPTSFRLDDEGASARRAGVSRTTRWDAVRSVYVDARGATLSPFARASWREPYRALRLLYSGNREEIVAALRGHLSERCGRGEVRWIETEKRAPRTGATRS